MGGLPELGEWKKYFFIFIYFLFSFVCLQEFNAFYFRYCTMDKCTLCNSGQHYLLTIPLTAPSFVNDPSEEWFQYKFVFLDEKGNFQYPVIIVQSRKVL